jgi:hypothetical protein
MSQLGFALFAAHENGATVEEIAAKLDLPADWIEERIEAARLCLRAGRKYTTA